MGKLLKKIPNSSKEILNKRIKSLNNSDLGVHDYQNGIYSVYNFDNKKLYNVIYKDNNYVDCNCSDYQNHCEELGLPCKHILAVKRFIESEPVQICDGFKNLIMKLYSMERSYK